MTHSDVRGSETPKGRVQDLSHLSYKSIVGARFHSDKLEPRNANKLKIAENTLNCDNGVCFRKLKHTKCLLLRTRRFQSKKSVFPTIQCCQKDYYPQR